MTTVKAYRKKPVVIEAEQFIPDKNNPNPHYPPGMKPWPDENGAQPRDMSWGYVDTLEGRVHVQAYDWIIKGIKGEYYPCKPDIFTETYEPTPLDPESPPTGESECFCSVDVMKYPNHVCKCKPQPEGEIKMPDIKVWPFTSFAYDEMFKSWMRQVNDTLNRLSKRGE